MAIELQYLGVLAKTAGKTSEFIDVVGSKSKVLDSVMYKYPGFRELNFVVSHNGTISHEETEVRDGDRITLIPPAPGG